MMRLSENWFTEGRIDFEYKKYILLAYLKQVEKNFQTNKLYPDLADLISHYQSVNNFIQNKKAVSASFPKRLEQIDLANFIMHFEKTTSDDNLMEEIERILDFSLPAIKKHLEEGKEIYDWIEGQTSLRPVGIEALDDQNGFLLLKNGDEKEAQVYEYRLTIFESASEKFRGIHTQFLDTYTTSITQTFENIKGQIIKSCKLMRIPAVYLVESSHTLPIPETLLPVAKRSLVKYLTVRS